MVCVMVYGVPTIFSRHEFWRSFVDWAEISNILTINEHVHVENRLYFYAYERGRNVGNTRVLFKRTMDVRLQQRRHLCSVHDIVHTALVMYVGTVHVYKYTRPELSRHPRSGRWTPAYTAHGVVRNKTRL